MDDGVDAVGVVAFDALGEVAVGVEGEEGGEHCWVIGGGEIFCWG